MFESKFVQLASRMVSDSEQNVERMQAELARLRAKLEADRAQLEQVRTYNRELEAQFNTQMDLIGALKRKLLAIVS